MSLATLIYNVDVVSPDKIGRGYVAVGHDGFISKRGSGEPGSDLMSEAEHVVDGRGGLLMPGAIDCHVHFREPGLTHKATMASESRAAVAGGVTSFIDMPNTVPQTTTREAVEDKIRIAASSSVANYGFFIGATNDNLDELLKADYTKIAGIKLFMGSSTGNMLVDSSSMLERLFESAPALISVHAEDEAEIKASRTAIEAQYGSDAPVSLHTRMRPVSACLKASTEAVRLAARYGTRLHIAHLTTEAELALLDEPGPVETKQITAEVSPHHLMWTEDDYQSLGARIKMNPSVKGKSDRAALRTALADGRIDIVATDHAPHLLQEKEGSLFKAVSGAPMVQFSLVAVLSLFGPEQTASVMADKPSRLFGIERRGRIAEGCYADLVLVSREKYEISDSDVVSLCGWTPMAGRTVDYKVETTWVNGNIVYDHGVIKDTHSAMALRFRQQK